ALGAGVQTFGPQDVDHGRAADLADAQLLQLAQDAREAPRVLVRQPQHQLADLLRGSRPAGLGGPALRARLAADPPQEGARRDNRDQLADLAAELPAVLQECLPLFGRDLDALGQFGPQDAVLLFQVFDHARQLAVGRLSDDEQKRVDYGLHVDYHRSRAAS